VVEYGDKDVDYMINVLENLPHHLTAACVSNDVLFTEKILSSSINGTTYHGLKARTTGAP
jgi:1-pyrroline-5-carboxylate dehydrogenase